MHRPLSIIFAVSCIMLGQVSANAFSDRLTLKDYEINKSGESEVRALGFIKLFDAALYLEDGFQPSDFPGDFSYGLSIRYHRGFKKQTLIKSADEILQDLYEASDLSAIQQTLDEINQYYVDVEKGDTYTLFYHPEKGTTLLFNNEPLVTLGDKAFAEIYFSIWLGGHPKCRQLKEDLL